MNKNELRNVVKNAQNGEKAAFEKLYKEYHEKLYYFVLKNVSDSHTASDITEDSFLDSMRGIASLKEPESYETWLHSIAFNKCRMYYRQKSADNSISLDDENVSENIHADDTVMLPEDYADNKELKRCLKKVIEGLRPQQRSAVILYYYDGMPIKKVSEILEISENAAKQKLFKARAKIKKEIEHLFADDTLSAVPISILLRTSLPKKYASSAAATVTSVKTSTAAVKIVGTAAALAVAVSVPVFLRGVNNNGFGVHDTSSLSDSSYTQSNYLSDSSKSDLSQTSSEKASDSSSATETVTSRPDTSSVAEQTAAPVVTTAAPHETSAVTTSGQAKSNDNEQPSAMPSADFPGEKFFGKTIGEMLSLSNDSYELIYPTFVQNGAKSMYKCSAFPAYCFGKAGYDANTGEPYVDKSLPVTRVQLYSGAYVSSNIYVGMTYNELCSALGEKPLMYLAGTDIRYCVSAEINGKKWLFGFDLTDEQDDEIYNRIKSQTDSETFNLNPYMYGADISDIDPVTYVAVCDMTN